MNTIIFNFNVSVLDTFVWRIMILTIRKLRIDSPAVSRKKPFGALIQSMHGERGLLWKQISDIMF